MTTTKEECQVTHKDHELGLQDMKQRHCQFYRELIKLIEEKK